MSRGAWVAYGGEDVAVWTRDTATDALSNALHSIDENLVVAVAITPVRSPGMGCWTRTDGRGEFRRIP